MNENEMREIEELESALTIIYGDDDETEIDWYSTARANYENGIRKVPDGAVVLTREEYERLNSYISEDRAKEIFYEECEKLKEQARKETAREILNKLLNMCYDENHPRNSIAAGEIRYIAKIEYRVEVDE